MSGSVPSAHRYVSVDALRFLAAMGIVTHHFATKIDDPELQQLFLGNHAFVDFFFAISGFVMFHSYGHRLGTLEEVWAFLRNRLARVYPLHVLTLFVVLAMGLTLWRGRSDIDLIVPSALLPNLLLIQAWGTTALPTFNVASWSISADWFLYLAFPAVAFVGRRMGAGGLLLLSILAVGGLEWGEAAGAIRDWTSLTYDYGMLRALPTFLAGAALGRLVETHPVPNLGFGLVWSLFLAALASMMLGGSSKAVILLLVMALVACVAAERHGARSFLTHPLMARLGDWSYAIYLTHGITGVLLVNFLGRKVLHLEGWMLSAWALGGALVPVIALAALIYRTFEVPARQFLRTPPAGPVMVNVS